VCVFASGERERESWAFVRCLKPWVTKREKQTTHPSRVDLSNHQTGSGRQTRTERIDSCAKVAVRLKYGKKMMRKAASADVTDAWSSVVWRPWLQFIEMRSKRQTKRHSTTRKRWGREEDEIDG
jgi:hypothetical protein